MADVVWVTVRNTDDGESFVSIENGFFLTDTAARKFLEQNGLPDKEQAAESSYEKAMGFYRKEVAEYEEYAALLEQGINPRLLRHKTQYSEPEREYCAAEEWWTVEPLRRDTVEVK